MMAWLRQLLMVVGLSMSFATAHGQFTPQGYASFTTTVFDSLPSDDLLFLTVTRLTAPYTPQAVNYILDQQGHTVWYAWAGTVAGGFQPQMDGTFTYNDANTWRVLDHALDFDHSVSCIGYRNDFHELTTDAQGHQFLFCIEEATLDLSHLTTISGFPGSNAADVEAMVIQELSPQGALIHEWRGLQHFLPEEMLPAYFTNPARADLHHPNSIALDSLGRLLVSCRSMNQVFLLDWDTDQVLWRLGGLNNEFDWQGQPPFVGQHDARLRPGGISLFDNGNGQHAPRALDLLLDTVANTVTTAWSHTLPGRSSNALGSYRHGSNGQRVIDFGRLDDPNFPSVYVVDQGGTLVNQVQFTDTTGSARAIPWHPTQPFPRPSLTCTQEVGQIRLGLVDPSFSQMWSNYETTPEIVVNTPGWYQAFVPYGIGWLGSLPLEVTDVQNGCQLLAAPSPNIQLQDSRIIGWSDLLGRALTGPNQTACWIEYTTDGKARLRKKF